MHPKKYILKNDYQSFEIALEKLLSALNLSKEKNVIKIDGRGGSGKTTLAKRISSYLSNSIHIILDEYTVDKTDLFDQQNIDIGFQIDFKNTKYDETAIKNVINESGAKFVIVEGCFSFKNTPNILSDLKIWVNIDKKTAKERLNKRESADLVRKHLDFKTISLATDMWQKSEDQYILAFKPQEKADLLFS